MRLLAACGALLVGLTLGALALHVPGAPTVGSADLKDVFIGIVALAVAVYFAAVRLVLRRPLPAGAVFLVLLVAVAVRIPVLIAPPFLSSDVYRYVWDGRVQAAGVNPYRYIPADPALAGLRDAAIYPMINRADYAPTIYPPAAQVIFAAVGRVSQTTLAMKAAMVAFEALAVLCLLRLLAIARQPPSRILIYAWNPLTYWSFAGNGHVDAAVIGLLAMALLLRVLRRDTFAGAVFGAAVLVKFLPVVVAPALWRARAGWRFATAAVAMIVALYACYAGVGWRVLGFLPGYGAEEGLSDGNGLWLLAGLARVAALPRQAAPLYFGVAAIGLAALGTWIAFRRHKPPGSADDAVAVCGGAAILMACLTAAISPHYPWYFAWLALPSVIRPFRAVLWLSAAPVLLYLDPLSERFLWPSLVYLPALGLALADLRWPTLPSPALAPSAVEENA
jgi:hypothetical protein